MASVHMGARQQAGHMHASDTIKMTLDILQGEEPSTYAGTWGPSHSADGVPLQQSASSTLKARPANLHHAATDVDREDNRVPSQRTSEREDT
ncbi:hypothetical protein NKJ52_30320 [Mesorhizobium australicum]|uniref:hypothetical protein n=1 Tax=Mesorhizobium australicum TaxID=536018 RepID=UPI0033366E0D